MFLAQAFSGALRSMRAHRFPATLTMVGIATSVAAVIVTAGVGAGLNNAFQSNLATYSHYFSLSPRIAPAAGAPIPTAESFYDQDVEALRRDSDPSVISSVIPYTSGHAWIRRGTEKFDEPVNGSTPDWMGYENARVAAGAMFTTEQYQHKDRVILLGPTIVKFLFHGDNSAALGASVFIGRHSFRVIGILNQEMTNSSLIPLTTARASLFGGLTTVQGVAIRFAQPEQLTAATQQAIAILNTRRHVNNPNWGPIGSTSSNVQNFSSLFTTLLWFITGVIILILFLGALGLANMTLTSVTERTREIATRRALGTGRAAIIGHILTECVLIAGAGGVFGVAIGAGLTLAGQHILPTIAPINLKPELSLGAIALAISATLLTALLAGSYPALRATRPRAQHHVLEPVLTSVTH